MKCCRNRWLAAAGLAVAAVAAAYAVPALRGRNAMPPEFDASRLAPGSARAVAAARAAVVSNPASGPAWGRLGMSCMAHDLRDEALRCFAEASSRQTRQFRWPYLSGILLEDSDQRRAEQSYAVALALEPDYAPLHWRRGQLLLRLDRLDAARNEFEVAARLDRDSPWPLLGLGHVALARGDETEARRHLEAAVERAPWSRDAHSELAGVLRRLGQASAAWERQQQASRLPPAPREMPDPVRNEIFQYAAESRSLAVEADDLTARGELAQAIGVLRKLVAESPHLSRPRVNLGQLLLAQGDLEGARAVFREAAERFPHEALAHYGLASTYDAAGAAEAAMAAYRRACELKPDYAEAHYRLGMLLWQHQDATAAAAALERAVSAEPGLAPAHLALGLVLRDLGDFDRAVEEARTAVRLAPEDPEPARQLEQFLGGGSRDPARRPESE